MTDVECECNGRRGERIHRVMLARHLQGDVQGRIGQREGERRAEIAGLIVTAYCRRLLEAEIDHAAVCIGFAPQPGMRVIGVEYCDTGIRQAIEYLALGTCDIFNRAKETDMRGQGVVDHCHIGCGQARQVVDFACMVHAHFQYGVLMRLAQAQQHQRQADVVVEIAFGMEHGGVRSGVRPQDRRQHFLDRGLAVAAGDGDHRNGEAPAPGGSQPAQCQAGIVDTDGGGHIGCLGLVEHRADRTLPQRLGGEPAAVELFAAQRDEEIARPDRPAIGGDAQHLGILTRKRYVQHGGGFGKTHHVHASSAFFATATSENGRRSPATSW